VFKKFMLSRELIVYCRKANLWHLMAM